MKSVFILSIAFLTTIGLFFLYERIIIFNPFMDPVAPYVVWGLMFLLGVLWGIRLIQASREKNRRL